MSEALTSEQTIAIAQQIAKSVNMKQPELLLPVGWHVEWDAPSENNTGLYATIKDGSKGAAIDKAVISKVRAARQKLSRLPEIPGVTRRLESSCSFKTLEAKAAVEKVKAEVEEMWKLAGVEGEIRISVVWSDPAGVVNYSKQQLDAIVDRMGKIQAMCVETLQGESKRHVNLIEDWKSEVLVAKHRLEDESEFPTGFPGREDALTMIADLIEMVKVTIEYAKANPPTDKK